MQETGKNHLTFKSKFGFLMAAAGSAIGLGNMWNFSYKLGTYGGGAFLITYLFMVLLMGIVVMVAEMLIGQRSQTNIVGSFVKINKRWAFVGVVSLVIAIMIATYYMVLGGWTIHSAYNSFNTDSATNNVGGFLSFLDSGWLPILLAVVFIGLTAAIISLGVVKGIERFCKVLMPALFVLLLIVVVRSLTLGEGVIEGISFMFHIDFVELGSVGVLAATGQAFYSLSLGMGISVVYGSYTKKSVNIGKSALLISLLDTGIALLAGLAIFPAVFAFDLDPASGITLMFVVLPQVFEAMGGVGMVFSFLFFTLLLIAALSSMISIVEVAVSYFADRFKVKKTALAFIICGVMSLVGCVISISVGSALAGDGIITVFGQDLLTLLDDLANKILMPITVICTCLAWRFNVADDDILGYLNEHGTNFKLSRVWLFLLKNVSPLIVSVVLVFGVADMASTSYGVFVSVLGCAIYAIVVIVNQLLVNRANKMERLASTLD